MTSSSVQNDNFPQWLTCWRCVLLCVVFASSSLHADEIEVSAVQVSLIDRVELAAEEAGVLRKIAVHPGDTIEEGTLIGQLDDTDAKLDLTRVHHELEITAAQAKNTIQLQLARKALGITTAELARAEESNEKFDGAVTKTEIERLKLARDQAELEIQQAEHEHALNQLRNELKQNEVEAAERQIQKRRLIAPLTGLVTKVEQHVGEWIQPGETFCEIIRTDRVRAEGYVAVKQGDVATGQEVRVILSIEGRDDVELTGIITFVDPQINPISQQYRVWATIDNPDGVLRPGHKPQMWINRAVAPIISSSK